MELDELRLHWDALGRRDPLWAILTVPEKAGPAWLRTRQAPEWEGVTPLTDSTFEPRMEMYCVPEAEVVETALAAGGRPVDIRHDTWPGPAWESRLYTLMKGDGAAGR